MAGLGAILGGIVGFAIGILFVEVIFANNQSWPDVVPFVLAIVGALAGRQAYYVPVGAMTRLQAGPFASRAEASAACARLAPRGQACFPVAAR